MNPNPVIENINTRRSTRKFEAAQVPEDLLQQVLDCGRRAPSGGNNQSCHFLVLQNAAVLQEIQNMAREIFAAMPYDEETYKSLRFSIEASQKGTYMFAYGAPTLVVVANKKGYGNAMADAACALENMMLAAHALGLGSCWVNQLRWLRDDTRIENRLQQLGLAADETVCGALALGYASTAPAKEKPLAGNAVTYVR